VECKESLAGGNLKNTPMANVTCTELNNPEPHEGLHHFIYSGGEIAPLQIL
jgi:hypothetical protein